MIWGVQPIHTLMKTYFILDPDTNSWSSSHLPLNEIMATPGVTGSHLLANAHTRKTLTVAQALAEARKPALKMPTVPLIKMPEFPTGAVSTAVPDAKRVSRLRPAAQTAVSRKKSRSEYKVLDRQDECFGGRFDASSLELVLNTYAQQGWKVLSCVPSAADRPAEPESGDFLIVMERKIPHLRAE